jgi:hypothetical protein
VFVPAVGDRDSDDLRQNSSALFPPEFYVSFLNLNTTRAAIGAEVRYAECVNTMFGKTGDDARTLLAQLGALVNSGLPTLIWAGDADINCNWLGGHASVLAMEWSGQEELNATPFTNMTINGTAVAAIQNVGNFSFARVYAAGHEVVSFEYFIYYFYFVLMYIQPAFQPETSLEIFRQVVAGERLHSV